MAESQQQAEPVMRMLDPVLAQDYEFYWEAAKRGELVTRTCDTCGYFTHPPVPMCPRCHGLKWTEKPLSGKGIVTGWLKVHHPNIPIFPHPNLIVTVLLAEGIEMVSNLTGAEGVEVKSGLKVEVAFEATGGGWKLPVFRPVAAG